MKTNTTEEGNGIESCVWRKAIPKLHLNLFQTNPFLLSLAGSTWELPSSTRWQPNHLCYMHRVSNQTTLPRQEIIAELIKACHTTLLGWPASARMRWPPLIVADNAHCIGAKSSRGTQHLLRDGHNAQCSEGAGEREDIANPVMHVGGSGLPLSYGMRMLPTATRSSWENVRASTKGWKNGLLCKSIINSLLETWDHLQLSFSSTGGAFQTELYWYGTKHIVMSYAFQVLFMVFTGLPCTWSPELGMTFQVQIQQRWAKRKNHLSRLTGDTLLSAIKSNVTLLSSQGIMLDYIEFCAHLVSWHFLFLI